MEILEFFSKQKRQKFKRGEIIISADDESSGIFFLESGYVKMSTIYNDGSELSVNVFKEKSYFPMIWAIGNVPNNYFYQAITPCVTYKASKKDFDEFISKNPKVLADLSRRIMIGLDGIVSNFKYIINSNATGKIASVLSVFAKRFGSKTNKGYLVIGFPLTHQVIASFAGVTRETTSIAMKNLMVDKVIFKSGKYLGVKSLRSLEKYFQ